MDVRDAIASRYSCRAFLPTPVPEKIVREIVERAARAPSAGNIQPWRVDAIAGERLEALKTLMRPRMSELPKGEGTEYAIYPGRSAAALQRAPLRRRRNAVPVDQRAARGQAGALQTICAQFRILRRAGRPLRVDRALLRARAMDRSRQLYPEHHAARPRLWPAHLPARSLGVILPHGLRLPRIARHDDAVLRHRTRSCRRGGRDQFLASTAARHWRELCETISGFAD